MKKSEIKLFGPTFWVHLPLVLLANFSWMIVPWNWIAFWTVILIIQYWIFGGCILTNKQFGKGNDYTFYTPYLEMVGVKLNRGKFKIYARYIHPFVLMSLGFTVQTVAPNLFPFIKI